jgi:hypothetical protein
VGSRRGFFSFFVCPPGPTAVGDGVIFELFLIFPAAPVYYFLKYIMESPYMLLSPCLVTALRHCTRLDYSVAVSAQSYLSVIVRQFYVG